MLSPLRKLACRQCHRTHFGFAGTAFRHDDGRTVPVDFALHCFGYRHLRVIQMRFVQRPGMSKAVWRLADTAEKSIFATTNSERAGSAVSW